MAALQNLVVQIQGLSGSDADLDSLHTSLRQQQTETLLRQNAGAVLPALLMLDYQVHSLGCMFLLDAKGRASNAAHGDAAFIDAAIRFLEVCVPSQIQRAPARFASLCRQLKAHVMAAGQPKRGVLPLRNAIAKLCPTTDLLSPVHADLFQLCLLSRCYSAAAPILDAHVTSVDPAKTGCTATAVLLYCYYGGMLETGRRRYSHALELFLAAITAPTYVVNAITVAALKKFILVALLHHGEVPPLPKHTAPAVSRGVKSEAGTYYDLSKHVAAAVRSGEATELCGFVTSRSDVWNDDGNTGLVQLVTARTSRRRVQALTHTYLTLTLPDVAAMAGLGSAGAAEDAVLGMVDGGEVEGRISEREGMVRFSDDNEENGAGVTVAQLHSLIQQTVALAQEVAAVDHSVCCDRTYIARAMMRSGGNMGAAGGRLDITDTIMADVERNEAEGSGPV